MQDKSWVSFFPEQASTFAWQVDYLYFYLIAISVFFTVGIVVAIGIFAVQYREKEKFATPDEMHGSIPLELFWSFIPFVISMTIFLGGAIVYYNQFKIPENSTEIFVVGKQWMWKIQHQTGQREINELHVPVDTKIKLTLTTEDVLHDFYIPAFRAKTDVVPGRYTTMWFEATKPGKYRIYCAEYCGLNHSGMGGFVYVMAKDDFADWLAGNNSDQTPVQMGEDLFTNKLGCASCHAGGDNQRGAKLEGIYNKEVKLVGGNTIVANDAYIRESILNPSKDIVEGYQPIMPTFKGQVTEEQLIALIAYIKSLSGDTSQTTSSNTMKSESKPAEPKDDGTGTNTNPKIPNNRKNENPLENNGGSK